jgi:hypothetical protein
VNAPSTALFSQRICFSHAAIFSNKSFVDYVNYSKHSTYKRMCYGTLHSQAVIHSLISRTMCANGAWDGTSPALITCPPNTCFSTLPPWASSLLQWTQGFLTPALSLSPLSRTTTLTPILSMRVEADNITEDELLSLPRCVRPLLPGGTIPHLGGNALPVWLDASSPPPIHPFLTRV